MGKAELPLHAPGTQLDRGYIGQSVPRPNAQRLLQGRGAFIDDLRFPRLAHVAFFRSPHAHARIKKLDLSKASASHGVIGVFDGRAVAEYCTPWVAVLAHLKGIKSPPQHAIAIERACWQGEACAAVVAETRTQAEGAGGPIGAGGGGRPAARGPSPRRGRWWRTASTSAGTPECASRDARSSPTTTPASIPSPFITPPRRRT